MMLMMQRITELTSKQLIGEPLSDEEKKLIRDYDARYRIVQFLYLDKVNSGLKKPRVTQFHFTPGDKFMETPIIDIVNELMKIQKAVDDGKIKPLDFGDSSHWVDNPPRTGMKKKTLI